MTRTYRYGDLGCFKNVPKRWGPIRKVGKNSIDIRKVLYVLYMDGTRRKRSKMLFEYLFLLFSVVAARACDPKDLTFVNQTAKIVNVEPETTLVKHKIGGTVKFLTGCSFQIRNFTVIPTGNGVYWYGLPVDNNSDPYPRVVTAAIGSYNGQTVTYNLDPGYDLKDISVMQLWSEGDNRAYGAFGVMGNVSTYFSTRPGSDIDFDDPTNPFNGASSSRSGKLELIFALLVSVYVLL